MIASFHDYTLIIWNCETFDIVWKKVQSTSSVVPLVDQVYQNNLSRFNAFSCSTNMQLLAYYGLYIYSIRVVYLNTSRKSSVFIWNLLDYRLVHDIIVPSMENDYYIHSVFLGNTLLCVLSNTGRLIFLDAEKGIHIGEFSSKSKV